MNVTGDAAAQTTVVLPVWDGYVAELDGTLASLMAQNVAARIVVVDNASTAELPSLGPPAEIVRSARRLTIGAARNLGLEHVTTPYVVFWDADDQMLPGTIAFLEASLDADRQMAAFGAAILEAASGARHRWPRRWIASLIRYPALFALIDCVWSIYPSTGATIMRTDIVRECGGYSESGSGEDWCLGVSLAFRGRLGWSERPGRVYRVHRDSVWAQHSPTLQLEHARNVRRRLREDDGITWWAKTSLPLIALAQWAAIAASAAVLFARSVRR